MDRDGSAARGNEVNQSTLNAHREIVAAHERISSEYTAAMDVVRTEFITRFAVIQLECGQVGHIYKHAPFAGMAQRTRTCVVCGMFELDPNRDEE
jgi:hypothetical protein